jgi:DNA-binding NarL/FixJ family response regulator
MIIDAADGLRVVAESSDGREAIEATRRITSGAGTPPRVVILTTFDLDEYVLRRTKLSAGASGLLLKDVGPEQLVDAIGTVAGGDSLLALSVRTRLIESVVQGQHHAPIPPAVDSSSLSPPRARGVVKRVARGLSNAEIADQLVLSDATVKTHITRVLAKLGLRDRVQAVVLAYETAIVRPGTRR